MKVWFLAWALPSIALAYHSTQQDCSPLDLRNSTIAGNRDQKEVSWCYAFTAADMLAHTFDLNTKISAADTAIAYNETKIGSFVRWLSVNIIDRKDPDIRKVAHQTGFTKATLIKSMKEGWCPESVFPSEEWTRVTKTEDGWKATSVPLATAMLDISALHSQRNELNPQNLPYYYSFKNVGAPEFVQLLKTKHVAGFYSSLRRTVCRDDRRPFDYNWKVKMVFKNPRVFKRISEQLEIGRPVALDYDSRILTDSTNKKVSLSELHTSNIVARRWNNERNTCEFLIRDSYGESCDDRYDPSYDCDAGNVWLSESQIYRNMTSVVYMLSGK